MANPMKIRARFDAGVVEVKALMSHHMETGRRKNAAGELIPAHFIQKVSAICREREVLSAQWGPAVSANPFLVFKFAGAVKGDRVKLTWTDNTGETRSDESTIV
ncbi:MAG: thiosulfate oxidation carrier complex protein SoxZ [Burkholderiales bacterium]